MPSVLPPQIGLWVLSHPFLSQKSEGASWGLPTSKKRKRKRNPDPEFLVVKKKAQRCLCLVSGALLGSLWGLLHCWRLDRGDRLSGRSWLTPWAETPGRPGTQSAGWGWLLAGDVKLTRPPPPCLGPCCSGLQGPARSVIASYLNIDCTQPGKWIKHHLCRDLENSANTIISKWELTLFYMSRQTRTHCPSLKTSKPQPGRRAVWLRAAGEPLGASFKLTSLPTSSWL